MSKRVVEGYEIIHTRKIDRAVARNRMKKEGLVHINKHSRGDKHSSYFSNHWRDYVR